MTCFVTCDVDAQTFTVIAEMLRDFHYYSRLQPNLQKSACFFAGISEDDKLILRNILNIPEAALPIKYLGVPLISTRLSYTDCLILKERMLRRIQSWSNKL